MLWSLNRKATDSRTFINIIHGRSNKYANWDPSYPLELGDYGTVDQRTGEFFKDGNIFKDSRIKNTSGLSTTQGAPNDKYTIASLDAAEIDVNATVEVDNIVLPADAGLKAQFKFGHRYGAMLTMCQSVTSKLEGLDELLCPENSDRLRKKHLISEIVTCTAYAMYLSGKRSETITIALCASAPVHGVPVAAEANGSWYHQGDVGVFRCGSQPDHSFTTLYSTVELTKNRVYRRELNRPPPELADQDCWRDSLLPWRPLNLEGEEEEDNENKDDYDNDSDW